MSTETNHSLLTDPFLERNEKNLSYALQCSHMEKFHLDALSVCSRQVLKKMDPMLSHYQKPKLNLFFVQMWKIPALEDWQTSYNASMTQTSQVQARRDSGHMNGRTPQKRQTTESRAISFSISAFLLPSWVRGNTNYIKKLCPVNSSGYF